MPTNHLTPYISDPVAAIATVVRAAMGQAPIVDGIHAGTGLLDYGALAWLDGEHPPMMWSQDMKALSTEEIGKQLDECKKTTTGVGATAIPWDKIIALVMELLTRWLSMSPLSSTTMNSRSSGNLPVPSDSPRIASPSPLLSG